MSDCYKSTHQIHWTRKLKRVWHAKTALTYSSLGFNGGWTGTFECLFLLKWSNDIALHQIKLFLAMCLWFKVKKKHNFSHTVHYYYYYCSTMPHLSEMCWLLQSSSSWEARRALIGQLSGVLWLAEYLKRVTEMLRHLPYCDACPGPTRLKQWIPF